MKNNFDEDALKEYSESQIKRFKEYFYDSELCNRLLYANEDCYGFCLDCEFIMECEVYEDIRDEWEGFYA